VRSIAILAALSSSACFFSSYVPGTVPASVNDGRRAVRTIGCLDVGLVLVPDRLDIHLGNRCSHPEPFDLKQMRITATDASGAVVSHELKDPRSEVQPLQVDASTRGRERFFFGVSGEATKVCFDLRGVNSNASEARPEPICFTRDDTRWMVSP
jgi:hypothetical protein